jgi:hypothetical protein
MQRTLIGGCAALLATLAVAGCGGSSSSTTPTDTWASGVCTAITTWQNQLKSIESSVKSGNVTKDSINGAVSQAKDATNQLGDSLKKLGKPDTQAGQQAKTDVQNLSNELSSGVKTIEDAISNASGAAGVLSAVSTAAGTLSTMVTQVTTTVANLQTLDPSGELEKAFKSSAACKPLLGS